MVLFLTVTSPDLLLFFKPQEMCLMAKERVRTKIQPLYLGDRAPRQSLSLIWNLLLPVFTSLLPCRMPP